MNAERRTQNEELRRSLFFIQRSAFCILHSAFKTKGPPGREVPSVRSNRGGVYRSRFTCPPSLEWEGGGAACSCGGGDDRSTRGGGALSRGGGAWRGALSRGPAVSPP